MRRCIAIGAIVSIMLVTSSLTALAQSGSLDGGDALTRALRGAWLSLESGLAASAREGTPLSAKYEIDDGTFQRSVYVVKAAACSGETFVEVIVDHDTATVTRVDTITDGGDLAAAQSQRAAMARAKRSLADATSDAVKTNAGYRA